MEFTEGEWKKSKTTCYGNKGYNITFGDEEHIVDFVYLEADANLIVASKDLHDIVFDLVNNNSTQTDLDMLIESAKKALNKADGNI
jgi:hypothetical protein